MKHKVATITSVSVFYILLILVTASDTINYQRVLAFFSYVNINAGITIVLWYIRFLAYVLVGAGLGYVVHIIPKVRTQGKWIFKWRTAVLWGVLPALMPIWFTLYYKGIVGFMPVHMLRDVPSIPLYNIMGFILGDCLVSCFKKQDPCSENTASPSL